MALYDGPRGGRATLLAATLGIGVAGAVSAARSTGWLEGLELAGYDRLVRWQAEGEPSQRVAVVRIREQDLARYGHPLPDAVLVRALERIAEQSPRAIGVDLYRTEPPPGDSRRAFETLGAAFRRDSRLVLIEKLPQDDDPGFPAPRFAAGTDQVGFSDVVIDSDGVVRRGLLILWDDAQRSSLSFSLQLALRYLRAEGISLAPDPERPEHVRLGATSIPALESTTGAYVSADARGYQFLLDFRLGRDGLPTYDLPDLLDGRLPAAALRDRVVLLGTTSRSVKDDFVTAHSAGSRVHGVELHSHAVDQLLRVALDGEAPARSWSDSAEYAWIAVWSLVGAAIVFAVPNPLALGAAVVGTLGAGVAAAWIAFAAGVWVPWIAPSLASLASSGLVLAEVMRRERAERRAVMDLFGRFVSRRVAEELWEHRDEFMKGGRPRPQRLVLTAMLTDLKGYTQTAEAMDPAALMDWVNEYMDAMTREVEAHGGIVDDYTGDGIKANFGAPFASADPVRIARDAGNAVRCAVAMGRTLERMAVGWRERGLPIAPMRVGLFTGEAVGGSLGSADRMKYTTVGDTVNTAARLESFHKDEIEQPGSGGGPLFRILIADSTRRHLCDDEFEIEDLGEHTLRGRAEPVRIHRVHGLRARATEAT